MTYKKQKIQSLFLLGGLCVFTSLATKAQVTSVGTKAELAAHSTKTYAEKIFVHSDRPLYVVGETMWCKLYALDVHSNRPADVLSKIAYLELLDAEGNSVVQAKVTLDQGHGNGSMLLPVSLPTGTYVLRSYTNWMKNFSPEFFFESALTILNPFEQFPPSSPERVQASQDVQFFPEGGQLAGNVLNRIAFRATDGQGKGIAFQGMLLNDAQDTLLRFEPRQFGIGSFEFTPTANETYRAVIRTANGQTSTYSLPTVLPQGYAVQLKDSTSQWLRFRVLTKAPVATLHLLAHHGASVYSSEVRQGEAIFLLDKSTLREGINHLTLFDQNARPVAERLYFKPPAKTLPVRAAVNKNTFESREKVQLSVNTTGQSSATMSVAVYLTDSLHHPQPQRIESYLLLTSDLKGTVESPDWYFEKTGPEAKESLDHLMLTHGWSRFRPQAEDVSKPAFAHLPEYGGHFLEGKVTNTISGQPEPYTNVYLAAPDTQARLFVAQADSVGAFRFEVKKLRDSKEIILQTNLREDSTHRIELKSPYTDKRSMRPVPQLTLSTEQAALLLNRSINMQTLNAFAPAAVRKEELFEKDSLGFYGKPDEKYFLDAYTRFPTMEEVMREYVPGVFVRKRDKKFHFYVIDKINQPSALFTQDPLILLDGVPIFDTDKIMEMDPLKIKKLEVIDARYYLGHLSFSGIVSYSTYKGDMAGFPLDPRALVLSYSFEQSPKEFYSPRYDSALRKSSRLPDFRNLLFWAPTLTTDAQGKQQVEFFTSDQPGTYQVVIQGVTPEGVPGSQQLTFDVKPLNN
ncbi:hypothetical protein [Arundinibacter roseus]|uniref:Macroglobulin domain-containing protein n=1 Tax=Arundinibacter roseus TaxID=2070510 RepID=A0A4R4K7W0_9BACT|nr:hypothetical protein [Arundinibacter roseus]TDB63443.1 hypothetical protein EZE20_16920 [Arundinibacter roseus]